MKHHDIYRDIVEQAAVGIYVISQNRLEYVNTAFEKITGISQNDITSLGLDFMNIIHPGDRAILQERRKARKEGRSIPSTYETRIILKDGTQKYIELTTAPVPGHADLVLGVVRDITERKLAEKKTSELTEIGTRYNTIIETAGEGIAIIQDGIIKIANPYLLKDSGFSPADLIDKPFLNFIATDYVDQIVDLNERRKAGEAAPSSYEAIIKTKTGKRAVEVNISDILYEGKPAFFAVIHNVTKYKEMEENLKDTLEKLRKAMNATTQAIAMIVEQRDPYTAGHQRRVADLARAIAIDLNLSTEEVDGIRMAGLLHDIGKIAVPSEILTKPTQLSAAEMSLIRVHPQVAYDILKTIEFPWPIAEIIYQHHERINGSGYPRGLADAEILPEARILAVADVVEAMITHRPYRAARKLEEALEEIERNKGVLYDKEIVEVCIRNFREKGFQFRVDAPRIELNN